LTKKPAHIPITFYHATILLTINKITHLTFMFLQLHLYKFSTYKVKGLNTTLKNADFDRSPLVTSQPQDTL